MIENFIIFDCEKSVLLFYAKAGDLKIFDCEKSVLLFYAKAGDLKKSTRF